MSNLFPDTSIVQMFPVTEKKIEETEYMKSKTQISPIIQKLMDEAEYRKTHPLSDIEIAAREARDYYTNLVKDPSCDSQSRSKVSLFFNAVTGAYLSDFEPLDQLDEDHLIYYQSLFLSLVNQFGNDDQLRKLYERLCVDLEAINNFEAQKIYLKTSGIDQKLLAKMWLNLNIDFSIALHKDMKKQHQILVDNHLPAYVRFYYYSNNKSFWAKIDDKHKGQYLKGFSMKMSLKSLIKRCTNFKQRCAEHNLFELNDSDFERAFIILAMTNKMPSLSPINAILS